MTNEDVIDLYNRVKLGTPVVVLALGQSDSPFNPRMALSSANGAQQLTTSRRRGSGAGARFGAVFYGRPARARPGWSDVRLIGRGRGNGTAAAISAPDQ